MYLLGTANYTINDWDDYEIVSPPSHGALTGSGFKRIYTPDPGFAGVDSIRFRLSTAGNYTNEATIRIYVDDITGRIDRLSFDSYSLRACVRDAADNQNAVFPADITQLECSGSTLLVGGTKYFWLEDTIDNCIGCDFGIRLGSIQGIQLFDQLQKLDIAKGSLSDLSPLSSLLNLTELHLPSVVTSDTTALSQLNNLTSLSFDSETISDFDGVAGLTGLEAFSLSGITNPEFDMSSIADVSWPDLERLWLSGNFSDIDGLEAAGLDSLTEFDLLSFEPFSMTALTSSALPTIRSLSIYLSGNQSLQGWAGNEFDQLERLSISGFDLVDLSALVQNNWPNLETLTIAASLDMTALTGTDGLELPSLKTLDVSAVRNLNDVSELLTWSLPQIETIIMTRAQGVLPCDALAAVEAQFPQANVQSNIMCLE